MDQTGSFAFDGDAVAWQVEGRSDGPPLVLVHGTPFSLRVWDRVAAALAERFRVYRFDLLGYGGSAKRAGQDVSLGIQNRVMAALLDHWGLRAPFVIAHDFGGATALRCHLLDGRDYGGLILVDPVALRPWGSPLVQHVRAHEAAFAGLPAYLHQALLRAYLATASATALSEDWLQVLMAPWLGDEGQAAFYRQIGQMDTRFTMEIEERLSAIRCPVHILWGEADAWIPVAQGESLQQAIPDAGLTRIPQAGHLVPLDAPEAVVATAFTRFAGD
ncbi:MAG: alpha/beta fold hydrolase [Alphaproteobacteria bacterium]|jgi:pimeloyl-ACP methyl ester carboxylesterase|nr:alpha/beta fold hydrolase [Alphaproteobacteria bacterium]